MIRNAIKRPQAQLHIRVVLCDSYSECVRVKCIKCACIMHDIKTLSVTMWPLFFSTGFELCSYLGGQVNSCV